MRTSARYAVTSCDFCQWKRSSPSLLMRAFCLACGVPCSAWIETYVCRSEWNPTSTTARFPVYSQMYSCFPVGSATFLKPVKDALVNTYEEFCGQLAANSKRAWSAAWDKRGKESWKTLGIFIGGGGAAKGKKHVPV